MSVEIPLDLLPAVVLFILAAGVWLLFGGMLLLAWLDAGRMSGHIPRHRRGDWRLERFPLAGAA